MIGISLDIIGFSFEIIGIFLETRNVPIWLKSKPAAPTIWKILYISIQFPRYIGPTTMQKGNKSH